MANQQKISLPVIRRLPRYFRCVNELIKKGVTKVSSNELANVMGTTASQVRQDFNCFGGFGQQGIGYNTELLHSEIGKLLYGNRKLNAILIGVGSLGHTISKWITAENRGYNLTAAFDINTAIIGTTVCGAPVYDVKELTKYCTSHSTQVAVLCIPKIIAEELAPTLCNLGIKGFWNFSHYDLSVKYPNINVENVHLGDSLMTLAFLANNDNL